MNLLIIIYLYAKIIAITQGMIRIIRNLLVNVMLRIKWT